MSLLTKTKPKEKTEGQFLGIFTNPQVSQTSSTQFVKKLTAVAISTIVYTRNLYGEDNFGTRQVEGIPVKVIKGSTTDKTPGARCISKWLEGAFDAIEKQYLRTLILEINDDSSKALVEMYTIKFSYEKESASCTVEESTSNQVLMTSKLNQTTEAIKQLLRNIYILTSSHDPIPSNSTVCLKLMYYDERTPSDYEPPGFRSCVDDPAPQWKGQFLNFKLGQVPTPYHQVGFSCKQVIQPKLVNSDDKEISVCNISEKSENNPEETVADSDRTNISENNKQNVVPESQDSNLYFRVLNICTTVNNISINTLKQSLLLDTSQAVLYMKRLKRDGVLKQSPHHVSSDKPDFLFAVHKSNLEECLKKNPPTRTSAEIPRAKRRAEAEGKPNTKKKATTNQELHVGQEVSKKISKNK